MVASKNTAMEQIPCSICSEAGHRVGRCNELWQNKTPPAQRGEHGDDEEDHLREQGRNTTISGKLDAHERNQTSGSSAGHMNPLSVISM